MARATDEVSVPAGKDIVTQGSLGHEFYLIVDGKAEVSRDGTTVAELGPGQYFGELALLDGAVRNATVTATEPTDLLVLGQRKSRRCSTATPGSPASC